MKIKSWLLILILIVLFLSGTLYMTNEWRQFQPYMLIGSLTLIIVMGLLHKNYKYVIDLKLTIIFFLFVFFSFLSVIFNFDVSLFIGIGVLLYMYISIVIILPTVSNQTKYFNNTVVYSFLVSHIPLVFFPMLLDGFNKVSYSGILYNPNSFGILVSTIFTVALSKLLFYIDKYIDGKKVCLRKVCIYILISIYMFLCVVFSSSRNSFLSSVFLVFLSGFLMLKKVIVYKNIKAKRIKKLYKILFFIILIFIVMSNFTQFKEVLQEGIYVKFERKSEDILDGRLSVWKEAISDISLFGQGRDYFSELGLGAHNTFISVLGQYGLISVIFFILFLIIVLKKSFNYLKVIKKDEYKFLPLFITLLFISLSMAEGMMLKITMILMFSLIGFMDINIKCENKDG